MLALRKEKRRLEDPSPFREPFPLFGWGQKEDDDNFWIWVWTRLAPNRGANGGTPWREVLDFLDWLHAPTGGVTPRSELRLALYLLGELDAGAANAIAIHDFGTSQASASEVAAAAELSKSRSEARRRGEPWRPPMCVGGGVLGGVN